MAKTYVGIKLQDLGTYQTLDPIDKIVIVKDKDEGVLSLKEFFLYVQSNIDFSKYYTASQIDTLFMKRADSYTRQEADVKFALVEKTYTRTQSDSRFAMALDTYTKNQSDERYAIKDQVYTKDKLYTKEEAAFAFAFKSEIPVLPDLTPYSTTAQGDIRWALKTEVYNKSDADKRFPGINTVYTKAETDGKYALLVNSYTKNEIDAKFLDTTESYTKDYINLNYYTKGELYTKSESDTRFPLRTDVYTIASVNEQFAAKSWVYSRGEAESTFAPKNTTYTKTEVNDMFTTKLNTLSTTIADTYYNKTTADSRFTPINTSYTKAESDGKYALISNTMTVTQLSNTYYDKTTTDAKYSLKTEALKGLGLSTTTLSFTRTDNSTATVAVPTWNQSTTGNAATATKLQTARSIGVSGAVTANAVNFDGTSNIALNATSVDATKLTGIIADAQLSGTYSGITIQHINNATNTQYTNGIAGNGRGRLVQGIAQYKSSNTTLVGAVVINTTMSATSSNVMKQLTIKGMNYNPGKVIDTVIQSYHNGSGNNYYPVKISRGTMNVDIRVATNATGNVCFILGDITTTWSHPHIAVTDALISYGATDANCVGWDILVTTDLTTYTDITSPIPESVSIAQTEWNNIQGKPTTVSGYGITDAYTKSEVYTKVESDAKYPVKVDATKSIALSNTTMTLTKADNTTTAVSIPTWNQSTTGNAATATKLTTPRAISITGAATATGVNFDGTAAVSLNVTTLDATKLTGIVPNANLSGIYDDVSIGLDAGDSIFTKRTPDYRTIYGMAELRATGTTGAIVIKTTIPGGTSIVVTMMIDGITNSETYAVKLKVTDYTTGNISKLSYGTIDYTVRKAVTPDGFRCYILNDVNLPLSGGLSMGLTTVNLGTNVNDAYCRGWSMSVVTDLSGYTNISGYAPNVPSIVQTQWNNIQGKPTTVSGYGITDAYTKSEVYTKVESDNKYAVKVNVYSKDDIHNNYYIKDEVNLLIDNAMKGISTETSSQYLTTTTAETIYAKITNVYDKTTSDGKYALIGSSYTKSESDNKYETITNVGTRINNATKVINDDLTANYAKTNWASTTFYTKSESDGKYALIGTSYTKAEGDSRYRLVGQYTDHALAGTPNQFAGVRISGNTAADTTVRNMGGITWGNDFSLAASSLYGNLNFTMTGTGNPVFNFLGRVGSALADMAKINDGGIWHKVYGNLHDYFAKKVDVYTKTESDAKYGLVGDEISAASITSSTLTLTKVDNSTVTTAIPTWNQSTTGNAATATKLVTGRTIGVHGAVTGTATSFDGSANISIPVNTLDATKLTGIVPNANLSGVYNSFSQVITNGNALYTSKGTRGSTIIAPAEYGFWSNIAIGAIVFTTALNSGTLVHFSANIKGMINKPSQIIDLRIQTMNTKNNRSVWTNKLNLGTIDLPVRSAWNANGFFCIIIGDTSTTWFYPKLSIVDVITNTVNAPTYSNWIGTLVTDLSTYTDLTEYWETSTSSALVEWSNVKSTPNTVSGYGITDAYTKSEVYTKVESDTKYPVKVDATKSITLTSSLMTLTKADNSTATVGIPVWNQNTTGNASTATRLQTPRSINGVNFDGSANISTPGTASVITVDKPFMTPVEQTKQAINFYFTSKGGIDTSTTADSSYGDFIVLNSYRDSTGGNLNALFFSKKNEMAIYHYQAGISDTAWSTPKRLAYTDSSITGNSATATKLQTARTISLANDASGTTTFDGTGNVNIPVTLANTGVIAGTYPKVAVDSKGRITNGYDLAASDIPGLDTSKLTSGILPLSRGGLGSDTQAGARTNLGLGTAATYNVGNDTDNVLVLGSGGRVDLLNDFTVQRGNVKFGLGQFKTTGGLWLPRLSNLNDNVVWDYQDTFAYVDKRKNAIITTTPACTNLSSMFQAADTWATFTDTTATSIVIEINVSSDIITPPSYVLYRIGFTVRLGASGWDGSLLWETWNRKTNEYVNIFDGVLNKGAYGVWLSPEVNALADNAYSHSKIRLTMKNVTITQSSPIGIQRLMMYNSGSYLNPWELSRMGGKMYGKITSRALTSGNAYEVTDSTDAVQAAIDFTGNLTAKSIKSTTAFTTTDTGLPNTVIKSDGSIVKSSQVLGNAATYGVAPGAVTTNLIPVGSYGFGTNGLNISMDFNNTSATTKWTGVPQRIPSFVNAGNTNSVEYGGGIGININSGVPGDIVGDGLRAFIMGVTGTRSFHRLLSFKNPTTGLYDQNTYTLIDTGNMNLIDTNFKSVTVNTINSTTSTLPPNVYTDANGKLLKSTYTFGTAATVNTGTTSGTIPVLDSSAKIPVSMLYVNDTLTSTLTTTPLSANQGKVLKGLIDGITNDINTNYSTTTQVDNKIKVVSDNLANNYYTKTTTYNQTEINDKIKVVSDNLANNYYPKASVYTQTESNNKFSSKAETVTSLSLTKTNLTVNEADNTSVTIAIPNWDQNTTGNAATATKLQTARSISLTGDVSGSVSFDGSANVSINTSIDDDSHNHSIATITGLQSALDTVSISKTTKLPATAGWYRIATSIEGINKNSGSFDIDWTVGGRHGRVSFNASTMYGLTSSTTLNQTLYSAYYSGITLARIVYTQAYNTNFAYLEIYNAEAVALTVTVTGSNLIGWSLLQPFTAGSIPSGYVTKELAFSTGFVTDAQFTSTVTTGTSPLSVVSTTKVDNLNADLIDGFHATQATTANSVAVRDSSGKLAGDITGNANTATSLASARTINGVAFDGSENITIADNTKLPLTGGTLTGLLNSPKLNLNRLGVAASGISWYNSALNSWQEYMAVGGTTGNGINGNLTAPTGTLVTASAIRSFAQYGNGNGWTFENGSASTTTPSIVAEIRATDGAARFGGNVTAVGGFTGDLAGNATSAGSLTTARLFSISGAVTATSVSFNGTGNVVLNATSVDATKLNGILPNSNLSGIYDGVTLKLNGSNTVFTTPPTGSDATARTIYGIWEYRKSSNVTGAIVIKTSIPKSATGVAIMKQLHLKGLLWGSQKTIDVTIDAYSNSTGPNLNTRKISKGNYDIPIRLAWSADNYVCVILGDVDSSWSYPHLTIISAMLSHNVTDGMCTGWSTILETSLSTYTGLGSEIQHETSVIKTDWNNIQNKPTKVADSGLTDVLSATQIADSYMPLTPSGITNKSHYNINSTNPTAAAPGQYRWLRGTQLTGYVTNLFGNTTDGWGVRLYVNTSKDSTDTTTTTMDTVFEAYTTRIWTRAYGNLDVYFRKVADSYTKSEVDSLFTSNVNDNLSTNFYNRTQSDGRYSLLADTIKSLTLSASSLGITSANNSTTALSIPTWNQNTTGNAGSATKLVTARTVSINGAATAAGINFDGTSNVALNVTSLDATKLSGTIGNNNLNGIYDGLSLKLNSSNTVFTTPSPGTASSLGRTVYGICEYRSSSTNTGAIVFNTTIDAASQPTMKSIEIRGMLYSASSILDTIIQTYNDGTNSSTRHLKINRGNIDVQIRIGVNPSGKLAIILGDTNTIWNYTHISITQALFSHSGANDQICTGWTTGVITDLSTYTSLSTDIPSVDSVIQTKWVNVSGTPTTVSGYGITDTLTTAQSNNTYAPKAEGVKSISLSSSNFTYVNSNNATTNVTIPVWNQNTTGNASTATKLQTERLISLTGNVTGSVLFDGSVNVSINTTVADDSHNHSITNVRDLQPTLDKISTTKNFVIPATAGWYRIATTSLDVLRNSARFEIDWVGSGRHGSVVFTAGIMYSALPSVTINQLLYSQYSGYGIYKARIVFPPSYGGNYAYLEVCSNTPVATNVSVTMLNNLGWTFLPSVVSTNLLPDGYNSRELTFVRGLATEGQIATNVETGIAPLKVDSTTKVDNLNADLLDGYNSSTTALANTIPVRDGSGVLPGNIAGNSATTTKLATARSINGVNFDGTSNITIEDNTKMPLSGGSFTGAVSFANNVLNPMGDDISFGDVNAAGRLGIKSQNNATSVGLNLYLSGDTNLATPTGTLVVDANKFTFNKPLEVNLTGTPLTPHPTLGDKSGQVASTYFVQETVGGYLLKSGLTGGTVTLTDAEVSNAVIAFSGTLTSNLIIIVPTTNKRLWSVYNSTTGAYTLTIKHASGNGVTVAQGKRNLIYTNGGTVYDAFNDFESIALTGIPTTPTAPVGNRTTQIASTAFVYNEIVSVSPTKSGSGAGGTWGISVTGNAATATRLQTARSINGVNFDGTANITIADNTKLPVAGGTMTGALNFANGVWNKVGDDSFIGDVDTAGHIGIKSVNNANVVGINFYLPSAANNAPTGTMSIEANRFWFSKNVDVNGNVYATGDVIAYSDRRLKDNIEPISDSLSKVKRLNGVTYTRNNLEDKQRRHIGLIAQDVLEVFPEAVHETADGHLSLNYSGLVGALVETIKELDDKNKSLEARLAKLEEKLA